MIDYANTVAVIDAATSANPIDCGNMDTLNLELLVDNSYSPKASWQVSTSSYKQNDLNDFLTEEDEVYLIEIPLTYFEYEEDYVFTATYFHKDFTLNINSVQCDDSITAPSTLEVTFTTPLDPCSGLNVDLTLSTEELAYWGSQTPLLDWTYSSNSSAQTDLEDYLKTQ